jgi:hypothetical protein
MSASSRASASAPASARQLAPVSPPMLPPSCPPPRLPTSRGATPRRTPPQENAPVWYRRARKPRRRRPGGWLPLLLHLRAEPLPRQASPDPGLGMGEVGRRQPDPHQPLLRGAPPPPEVLVRRAQTCACGLRLRPRDAAGLDLGSKSRVFALAPNRGRLGKEAAGVVEAGGKGGRRPLGGGGDCRGQLGCREETKSLRMRDERPFTAKCRTRCSYCWSCYSTKLICILKMRSRMHYPLESVLGRSHSGDVMNTITYIETSSKNN